MRVEAESFVNKLSVTGNQSLSTGRFPRSSLEQCPLKILGFLPGAVVISLGGFGGLSLPFHLTQPLNENVSEAFFHIPSGCCLHPFPFHFASWKSPGWVISQDLTYTPSKETSFMLGEGLRLWRAGAFKKIPFPFPYWKMVLLSGGCALGDRRTWPCICL